MADYLKSIVEQQYECTAAFRELVHVTETHEGETVWDGEVVVFDVTHAEADKVYVFGESTDNSDTRYFAVLGKAPIDDANAAVRAAIVKRFRETD